MYSCTYSECVVKAVKHIQQKKEDPFVPLRLLVCGHSICELCVLQFCQQKKEFIKCTICSFNTTLTESDHKNVVHYESDIKKWLDPTSAAVQVLRMDMKLFPLDLYQIGNGIDLGLITATKTAEMIDLDLDDDSVPNNQLAVIQTPINSLTEDDTTVRNIVSRIPKTAQKSFQESVEKGVKTYTELSANYTQIQRTSDETKEYFKKSKTNTKEMFHKLHSILQMREKELLEEIDGIEESRHLDLRVFMNEILSKRSELKGKLLQSSQLQTDRDRNALKKSIDHLVKDSNAMPINSPESEFKFIFEPTIESKLKVFGKVDRNKTSVTSDNENQNNSMITVSSDEEEEEEAEDNSAMEDEPKADQTMNKEVVNILQVSNPNYFYVQKESDKERFEHLNEQIQQICRSAYNHSPAIETLPTGEFLFAYSRAKRCWCRASLIHFRVEQNPQTRDAIYLADIKLIDYGLTETVEWFNVREKKMELFDDKKWPPFAYKCSLYNIRPIRTSTWSREAIDLFNQYVTNNQLILFDFETRDGIRFVDLIHYDVPDVTYQIPTIIEVLTTTQFAAMTSDIDFQSYCRYRCQPLKYLTEETPKTMKTISVLVSHVESPDLFFVQLQRQHQNLMNLINEMNAFYNEENAGLYTYYCPKLNTPCAALFEGDNKYYRALVVKKENSSKYIVQFVDFGNKQPVLCSDLRLLKNSYLKFPMQSIACGLIHVEPSFGFKWSADATKQFKISISNDRGPQILTMCVYEVKQNRTEQKLMVVLRSYDGVNTGVKINEVMVKTNFAVSSGQHSEPDFDSRSTSQESLNSMSSGSQIRAEPKTKPILPFKISAILVLKDLVERQERSNSDKRSSLIKVIVSFVNNPKEFYVQIDRPEVKDYFDSQEKALYKEYSSAKYQFLGDTNFNQNDLCAFKVGSDWRRGKVLKRMDDVTNEVPEEPRYSVFDIDYGSEHEVKATQMRRLSDEFLKDGSFSLKCKLYLLQPTGGNNWTQTAKDGLIDFVEKFNKDLYILVKGKVETEPISVILFSKETQIPGAFERQKTVFKSINKIFVERGLATYDRTEALTNGMDSETDDDMDINAEPNSETRTQMPFSMFSNGDSILESLKHRFTDDSNPQIGKYFQYLPEIYPKEQTFYGIGTSFEMNKEFNISFRHIIEGVVSQPSHIIDNKITETLNAKGELEPFVGPFTKGNACSSFFEFDKTWNRAEIVGVSKGEDHSKLIVRFVDYGNEESVLVDKLSADVFCRDIPKLALKCQIINIQPKDDISDKKIRNIIHTQVLDSKCRYYWENYPKRPMKVSLEILVDNNFQPLLSVLESQNLVVMDRIEQIDVVEQNLNYNTLVEKTYGLYPIHFVENRFYEMVISFPLSGKYAYFQATEVKDPISLEMTITEEHDSFIFMLEQMRGEVNNYPDLQYYREGHPCVALYSDNCWYRGLVLNANMKEKTAEIFFVDYGNTDFISFNNLREIPKRHMKPKAHSMLCEMWNIKPANNQLWSRNMDLSETIANHLNENCTQTKIFAKFKNRKYPLKIDLYFCDEDDQTMPDKHVFQDFVDKGVLDFVEPRGLYHKPIQPTQSYRTPIKIERMDY